MDEIKYLYSDKTSHDYGYIWCILICLCCKSNWGSTQGILWRSTPSCGLILDCFKNPALLNNPFEYIHVSNKQLIVQKSNILLTIAPLLIGNLLAWHISLFLVLLSLFKLIWLLLQVYYKFCRGKLQCPDFSYLLSIHSNIKTCMVYGSW